MSLLTTGQQPFSVMQREHAELKSLLESLTKAIRSPQRDQGEVRARTEELVETVSEHFELEERGGYFADAVRRAPNQQATAVELQAQHGALLQSLEALRELAQLAVKSDAGWTRFEEKLVQFSDDLLHHEAGERALLQRAYGQDIGAGD
jgi:iron-sulfur cluster repair protein YtfE (RIC family)